MLRGPAHEALAVVVRGWSGLGLRVEARGEWRVTPDIRVRAALAYARGEDLDTRQPMDGVDPFRANLGIAWQAPVGSRFQGLGAVGEEPEGTDLGEPQAKAEPKPQVVSLDAFRRRPTRSIAHGSPRYCCRASRWCRCATR